MNKDAKEDVIFRPLAGERNFTLLFNVCQVFGSVILLFLGVILFAHKRAPCELLSKAKRWYIKLSQVFSQEIVYISQLILRPKVLFYSLLGVILWLWIFSHVIFVMLFIAIKITWKYLWKFLKTYESLIDRHL